MEPVLLFTQLEFTHALGPDPGRYLVGGPETAADRGAWLQRQAVEATADVLALTFVPGEAARRRRSRREETNEVAPVGVMRATLIGASTPMDAEQAHAATVAAGGDREAARQRVEQALAVLNRAIRAHRAAAGDPYLPELTARDPRVARLGYGTGEELAEGEWTHAIRLGAPRDRTRRTTHLTEYVGRVLRGELEVDPTEDLALRALADVEQGRHRAAVLQVRAAVDHRALGGEALPEALARDLRRVEDVVRGAADLDADAVRAVVTAFLDLLDGARGT